MNFRNPGLSAVSNQRSAMSRIYPVLSNYLPIADTCWLNAILGCKAGFNII